MDIAERIAELRLKMEEEGELGEPDASSLEGNLVFDQKMKLVQISGANTLYAVPSSQDWEHDALGEAIVCPGTFHAESEPFQEGAVCVSGYFQADADGRWLRIDNGSAAVDISTGQAPWRENLEEFPEVVAQLEECMSVPDYRHAAEQATLKWIAKS